MRRYIGGARKFPHTSSWTLGVVYFILLEFDMIQDTARIQDRLVQQEEK
jgi:hypothetical protein